MQITVKEFIAIFNENQETVKSMQGQLDSWYKELDEGRIENIELKKHFQKQRDGMTNKMAEYRKEIEELNQDILELKEQILKYRIANNEVTTLISLNN